MNEADWVSYEEACAQVMARVDVVGTERVPTLQAYGRALRETIHAPVPHPPWDNSAMDGFAVRASDVAGATPQRPVTLPVSDDVPAGSFPAGPLALASAARVMTGAPVPEGATGVIRVEHTDGGSDAEVQIVDDADANRHIRRKGEDTRTGDTLLVCGEELNPAAISLLAMAGRAEVSVGRRPRIGVLANGDELADFENFDEVLAGRKIMNSNGPAIAAQVVSAGGEVVSLGLARDDPADLRRCLARADRCDAIISAAGVSVGDHDYLKSVLDELGFERDFWRIQMRPGSATVFGRLGARPFWGVPGNPVSALVTFETLIRPAIRKMVGFTRHTRHTIPCAAEQDVRGPANVVSFFRVLIRPGPGPDDALLARLTGPQGSGILTSMLADGLLVLPKGTDTVNSGETVQVLPLREWVRDGTR